VAVLRPLAQFAVDLAIYPGEGALGDTRAIVQRPAADDGVEGRDEGSLGHAPVAATGWIPYTVVLYGPGTTSLFWAGLSAVWPVLHDDTSNALSLALPIGCTHPLPPARGGRRVRLAV